MLSIDRMENHSHIRRRYPRYHSSLFRGQPAWDPHTHVVLPLSVLSPLKAEGEHVGITQETTRVGIAGYYGES